MNKKIFLLSTALVLACTAVAGLPEALMSLDYQQYPTALAEFQALAEQGNASALFYLGRMYQNGWGVPRNIQQAARYFKAADESFYLPASAQLGKILLRGAEGVSPNPTQAIHLLKKAALAGDIEATFELGNAALDERNGNINYNHAYGFYLIAALHGEKRAQFQLSQMYLAGRGIPQDYQKALTWMSRSANQGYIRAQSELAKLYETNTRLKNLPKAYAWNSILAAYNSDEIGALAGKKRDQLAEKIDSKKLAEQQEAVRNWLPRTPDKSVPPDERRDTPIPTIPGFNDPQTLQQILEQDGYLAQNGFDYDVTNKMIDIAEATGDRTDLTNAIEKTLKKERIQAAAYYGDLLYFRFHLPEEAVKWYQKGADGDDPYAQYQLARAYCEGWAAAPDATMCYAWLLVAAEKPNPVLNGLTQKALLAVRSNATSAELERGKAKAETIKKNSTHEKTEKKILDFF